MLAGEAACWFSSTSVLPVVLPVTDAQAASVAAASPIAARRKVARTGRRAHRAVPMQRALPARVVMRSKPRSICAGSPPTVFHGRFTQEMRRTFDDIAQHAAENDSAGRVRARPRRGSSKSSRFSGRSRHHRRNRRRRSRHCDPRRCARPGPPRPAPGPPGAPKTGFGFIGIRPSRCARLRASLRARRTASAFSRAFFSEGFS